MQIGSAYAARMHTDEDLAGAGRGIGNVREVEGSMRCAQDHRAHDVLSWN
jgi:hypothetical protein